MKCGRGQKPTAAIYYIKLFSPATGQSLPPLSPPIRRRAVNQKSDLHFGTATIARPNDDDPYSRPNYTDTRLLPVSAGTLLVSAKSAGVLNGQVQRFRRGTKHKDLLRESFLGQNFLHDIRVNVVVVAAPS